MNSIKTKAVLLLLLFISCNIKEKEAAVQLLKNEVKQLKIDVNNLKKANEKLINDKDKLNVTVLEDLIVFDPKNLKICLSATRPVKTAKIFLVVPAAFTDPKDKIDGLFIDNGVKINDAINNKLNGFCIISNNSLTFLNSTRINQTLIKDVIKKEQSLFQQLLLVLDFKIVDCNLFNSRLNLRRALVEINNYTYLVESKNKVTIKAFQNSLISNNVKNAIYLDMGTYSEGWYRANNKIMTIGETMTQTYRQSNWLVFESL